MSNDYKRMKCFNRMTGQFVGFMGTQADYVSLVESENDAVSVKWSPNGGDTYLARQLSPNDRYLALSNNDYAGWDLWANVNLKPVVLNGDGTISLKGEPARVLYGPYRSMGSDYLCWTEPEDKDNSNVLIFKPE